MTDTNNTTDEITPEQAEAELATLEQQVIDGGDVTVADLTAAKERISFARLVRQGLEARAEKKRLKDADDLRAKTKADVTKRFTDGEYISPFDAYDAAVKALNALVVAIENNNVLLDHASYSLSSGGVVAVGWDGTRPADLDESNHSVVGQGNDVHLVKLAGVTYFKENAAVWAQAAVQEVAKDHNGLPIPYRTSIANALGSDRPPALKNRTV
jgi:hypothetical protein